MDHLVVVPHPNPIALEARSISHGSVPDGAVGLGYYYDDRLIARSVVAANALDTIQSLLSTPVSVALAAREDRNGNIDGRLCLVLPVEPGAGSDDDADESGDNAAEPWKASVPAPPPEVDGSYGRSSSRSPSQDDQDEDEPQFALLPIGNVIRAADDRHHPEDVAHDAKEMLENLLTGGGRDAVQKAIEDLLNSI